jgi:hypothetical protein
MREGETPGELQGWLLLPPRYVPALAPACFLRAALSLPFPAVVLNHLHENKWKLSSQDAAALNYRGQQPVACCGCRGA